MNSIKIFLIVSLCFISLEKSLCQFFIQPKVGAVRIISRALDKAPLLQNISYYDDAYFGVNIGKKNLKFSHAIGYTYYPVGVRFGLIKDGQYFLGYGEKHIINHNIFYDLLYSLFKYKRMNIDAGVLLNYSISQLTWGAYSEGLGGSFDPNTNEKQYISTKNYASAGTQIIIEPQLNLELRISEKIAWVNHFGYNIGYRTIYKMEGEYLLNDVPKKDGTGSVYVNGTALMFGTGFKFYFKSPQSAESKK